jgi:hypothetical protein
VPSPPPTSAAGTGASAGVDDVTVDLASPGPMPANPTDGPPAKRPLGPPPPGSGFGSAASPRAAAGTGAPAGSTPAGSAAAGMPATAGEPAGRRFGDYELVREVARGGMGVVYEAVRTSLSRTVAVKMILAGEFARAVQVQRFFAEARSVAALDHPNIVPVYDVGEHVGLPFFSMKLVEGGSLTDRLAAFPADPAAAAALVEKTARAVHHAHQRGVLHRDLKPANILLDAAGEPLVTDFGLAKVASDDAHLTRSDSVVGTPAYMAPEQVRGAALATTATDTWALGAILYHLVVGGLPFQGATGVDTMRLVLDAEPTAPRRQNPRVPRDFETICLKCLRKDPAGRYPSADALAEDLRRFRAGEPVAARPVGVGERPWRWCRRNPGSAAAAAVAVAGVAAAVAAQSVAVVRVSASRDAAMVAAEGEKAARREADREVALGRLERACAVAADDPAAGLLHLAAAVAKAEAVGAADLATAGRLQFAAWSQAVHPLRSTARCGEPGSPTGKWSSRSRPTGRRPPSSASRGWCGRSTRRRADSSGGR